VVNHRQNIVDIQKEYQTKGKELFEKYKTVTPE
jgi:hypothetical protein